MVDALSANLGKGVEGLDFIHVKTGINDVRQVDLGKTAANPIVFGQFDIVNQLIPVRMEIFHISESCVAQRLSGAGDIRLNTQVTDDKITWSNSISAIPATSGNDLQGIVAEIVNRVFTPDDIAIRMVGFQDGGSTGTIQGVEFMMVVQKGSGINFTRTI